MRLRKPCEHVDETWPDGRYEAHWFGFDFTTRQTCPGGEFLPEDALADIAWQFNEAVSLLREVHARVVMPEELAEEILDGLPAMQSALTLAADQVGEPG